GHGVFAAGPRLRSAGRMGARLSLRRATFADRHCRRAAAAAGRERDDCDAYAALVGGRGALRRGGACDFRRRGCRFAPGAVWKDLCPRPGVGLAAGLLVESKIIVCGIAGIVNLRSNAVAREDIARITDLLAHRGPDGDGFWFSADRSV